ncbi:PREDICTED: protein Shroom4 [Nanorana parkeri]|uniref:protein Shroom4 n=1 Tax=Nanorana parkeri TaxID=125878 RepID=UPI000854D0B2|nr:PREDICTED: protein Shroom4 [Nanorana parkeri]
MDPSGAAQCIHVQLQGGAPWGFTLRGGLEHGEPLIISKIEDGGKAEKSEKMEVGDELVNINGTPLYGSRQEALILIKGSYKILKMIVRRRNVSVVRPHSWHLAKLSEVRPDVASMQYPTDAFSLSWHSGCEASELPMQWNPLSRHCSTDKSSSIGSMESLDQPGHNYYEGTLSPIDPGMYQNKRDSAYSSFSASSNTSDYTVSARTEESSPINCVLRSTKQEDGRYLQTGQSSLDPRDDLPSQTLGEHPQHPSSLSYDSNHLDIIKSPPQPPVRRDSLRASKNPLCHSEKRRASAPGETFYIPGKWSKDFHQLNGSSCGQCQRAKDFCALHQKENLSSDQYYMLSSQADCVLPNSVQPPVGDTGGKNNCTEPRNGCSNDGGVESNEVVACYTVQKIREAFLKNSSCDLSKPEGQRSSQREGSSAQTVFRNDAKMAASNYCYDADHCNGETGMDKKCNRSSFEGPEAPTHPETDNRDLKAHRGLSFDRSGGDSKEDPSFQPSGSTGGRRSSCSTNPLVEADCGQVENAAPTKKPGSSRHRSAQMRRRSDRFATNLRNEIQNRKAQLQKSKGSSVLCDEPVEERDEPAEGPPRPAPPPPPPKNKARLVEIKKANAELFGHSDSSSKERNESHGFDKNKSYNCTREGMETPTTETVPPEDEEVCVAFRNKVSNDWWKNSSSCVPHQESPGYEESYVASQQPIDHSLEQFNGVPSNASLKSDSCRDDWRRNPSSKPTSPEAWDREKGNIVDRSKCNEEPRDSSVHETNHLKKLWRAASNQNLGHGEPPEEAFAKTRPEDTNSSKNHNSFGPRANANSTHHGKEHLSGERYGGDQRTVNYLEDIGLEQKTRELRLHDLEKSDATPSKASHQPSGFEEQVSHHKPHGARWTLSPDSKPQPYPHCRKESPPEVADVNVEEVVPPITRVTEANVLLPFADRRRFFEDSSKGPPPPNFSMHMKANKNGFCASLSDYSFPQAVAPDLRRHSVDHTCHSLSPGRQESSLACSEFCMNHAVEPPLCCNPNGHLADYLHSVSCGYRSCVFCPNDVCPALLKRNMSMTHHSCHCQHHHHHHRQWTRCSECLCPSQHPSLEEGAAIHGDPWHLRNSRLQEVSLKEWNQQLKINRKCSQSVSELCQFNSGFHYPGPHKSFCEDGDQERPQCYKAASTYDLSCELPLRPLDLPSSMQDGPPQRGLSRDRSYSVNHLNLEHLTVRGRQEAPLVKLEHSKPSARPKKQGPPRPPPPNWEKYKERRSSHDTAKSVCGHACGQDVPNVSGYNRNPDDARQRSQSLPLDKTFSLPPMQGADYCTEPTEMRSSPTGPQDRSLTGSPNQETSNDHLKSSTNPSPHPSDFDQKLAAGGAEESEAADEGGLRDQQSSTMAEIPADNPDREPPSNLVDLFEGNFHRYEDDWSTDRESEISIPERYEFQPISPPPVYGDTSPTSCTSYYNTSAAKAELLNKMKEMPEVQEKSGNVAGAEEEDTLTYKKMQLIESISKKLSVLHEAQQGLQEDITANVTLGCELESLLKSLCKPNEYDKFRSFIGDLDKVVNLLLSLSGRLIRVESALHCIDLEPSMEEKLNLLEKKKQLTDQLEDAQELKAHVTRREQLVLQAVSKYLNEDQLQDYQHYVKMTSALIVEQRELEDKIRLGEEQLRCLRESL